MGQAQNLIVAGKQNRMLTDNGSAANGMNPDFLGIALFAVGVAVKVQSILSDRIQVAFFANSTIRFIPKDILKEKKIGVLSA